MLRISLRRPREELALGCKLLGHHDPRDYECGGPQEEAFDGSSMYFIGSSHDVTIFF
jgi:hypothetical protein